MTVGMEPCWTGLDGRATCHRGGIGCPLPHPDDPDEHRRVRPRRILAANPLPWRVYPPLPPRALCPRHRAAATDGRVTYCPHCPWWRQWLQRHRLTRWTRANARQRRARRRAMRALYAEYGLDPRYRR